MQLYVTLIYLIIIILECHGFPMGQKSRPPVILVPGDGGSQMEARLNKESAIHYYCHKKSDWFTIWLSLRQTVFTDCFIDNMKLRYDNKTRRSYNQPGVEIRLPGFGDTDTVEWLDPSHPVLQDRFAYFHHIVEALVSDLKYTRGVNIHGAPYDFRKAPNEMDEFFRNLTDLVENTYVQNNNVRVVLIGHSMGNLYLLYWLNNMPQSWKDKYIRTFITLGGPWGGSVKPLRLMAAGDPLGARLVFNPLKMRILQRSLISTAFLMPYKGFWSDEEVLVYAPHYNYTVNDYRRFFHDISFPNGYLMRQDTENLIKDLEHPGVETHCLYGSNVSTPLSFTFKSNKKNWMDFQPDVTEGNGDGTVNTRSLEACLRWVGTSKEFPVSTKEFKNAGHVSMLGDTDVIEYITKVVGNL